MGALRPETYIALTFEIQYNVGIHYGVILCYGLNGSILINFPRTYEILNGKKLPKQIALALSAAIAPIIN